MVAARNQAADHLQSVSNSEGYASRIRNPADVSSIGNRQLEYFDRQIDAIKNKTTELYSKLSVVQTRCKIRLVSKLIRVTSVNG